MRRPSLVLAATSLAAFTATLDNTVVAVALRSMQQDLGASVLGLQGVITAYTVALAALLLIGGGLVDVLGAKRVLLAGLVVFGAASAGCALCTSVGALVAVRAVQGLGASLLLPGGLAVLSAAYPVQAERRRAIGIWAAVSGLALVAGPVVGGLLVSAHGWQSVFWVNVPLCLLVAVALIGVPSVRPVGARLDVPGSVLTCATLGLATYSVVLAGKHSFSLPVVLALVMALAALVVVERRAESPLLPGDLLRQRRFTGGALAAFCASLAVFVLLVFVSLFLQLIQGQSARSAGLLLLPLPLAIVVVSPLRRQGVVTGLLLSGAGLLGLGLVLRAGTSHWVLEVFLGVVGIGVGLTTAPAVTAALSAASEERSGVASAGVNVARELGGVVAIAGLGALAVARLTDRLTAKLDSLGVTAKQKPHLLDLLLQADTMGVRIALLNDVGIDKTLKLGKGLQTTATASFVSSTQVVLVAAGAVLLLLALVVATLLKRP